MDSSKTRHEYGLVRDLMVDRALREHDELESLRRLKRRLQGLEWAFSGTKFGRMLTRLLEDA